MRWIPWFIAGVSVSLLVHILQGQHRLGAAASPVRPDELSKWEAKQSGEGGTKRAGAKLKEAASELTGDDPIRVEGIVDQIVGEIRMTAGKPPEVVHHEMRDLEPESGS
jgi:uncharacterized protein YjbJ (UPF0337 family)